MQVNVHNRSDLYVANGSVLVAEGIHEAELVAVRTFENSYGTRVGLVFRLADGTELVQSAAPGSPRGKLAELLHGLGGDGGTEAAALELVGRRCKVTIRHRITKTGKVYAVVVQTIGEKVQSFGHPA